MWMCKYEEKAFRIDFLGRDVGRELNKEEKFKTRKPDWLGTKMGWGEGEQRLKYVKN